MVKAALEGQTLDSLYEDLGLEVSRKTVRAHLNTVLDGCDRRMPEAPINAGLVDCSPEGWPGLGLAMAVAVHAEPFYGNPPDLRTYACRGEASQGPTYFYRVASPM